MHYSKRGTNKSSSSSSSAVAVPSTNFGIVAKAHPAFVGNASDTSKSKSGGDDQCKTPQKNEGDHQEQPQQNQLLGNKNFELVSLRSPKPPAASEQVVVSPSSSSSVAAQTARTSTNSASASGGKPPSAAASARTGSAAAAAAAGGVVVAPAFTRTDSLSSLTAKPDQKQQQQEEADDHNHSSNSRALVPTPKSSATPLVPVLPTSPTSASKNTAAVLVSGSSTPSSSLVVSPQPKSVRLSDSRLPVVGSSFIAQNRRNTTTPAISVAKQQQQQVPPSSASTTTMTANTTSKPNRYASSFSALPPIALTQSHILMQQLTGVAVSDPFADTSRNNNNKNSNNSNSRGDLGAALTLFSAAAPSGPLSSKSASHRNPKHWTDMLPAMAELEQTAGAIIAKQQQQQQQKGQETGGGVSSPTSSTNQGHHSVPPLAAELLGFIRRELKMIYAPFFEKRQQQQLQSPTSVANSNSNNSNGLPEQIVHSPDVKLARWRVFLDAFRNLAGHFREYGPFMNIILRETEDMYSALQQHSRDRTIFAMVANQTEGVAAELARETTKSVFDELHATKRRNGTMQDTLKDMDAELLALKQKLSVTSDERMRVGNELDNMTSRCRTLIDALQGEANRQNAAFAEAKSIREENDRLRANIRALEEQRKNDSLLQEELFSKLDQLSLAMSEGGLNFSKVMDASPTARAKMFADGFGSDGGAEGGGDDSSNLLDGGDSNSPYRQQENIRSLEGMRRWGSMMHMNMMKAREGPDDGNTMSNNDDEEFRHKYQRRADRRLSTVMEGLLGNGNPNNNNDDDDDEQQQQQQQPMSPFGNSVSSYSATRSAPQKVAHEARRDRDALVKEKMMKESMKFAASCSGDTAAEKLQEALLRCFAKVRKYRGTITVLRQTIERLDKKIQKLGSSALQQQMIIQQQQLMSRSGMDALSSGPSAQVGRRGSSSALQPSWSARFGGAGAGSAGGGDTSGVFESGGSGVFGSSNNNNINNNSSSPRALGAVGRSSSFGGAGAMLNQQLSVNLRPFEAADLARFDSQRPLTPRPMWERLKAVVPSFDPFVDPETGVMPSSDDLLEELAERLREQQSEKLKEAEKRVLSKRVTGWVDEENNNSKTHHVRSAKASDITSLLMASSRSFVGLGGGPDVPAYLRYSGRLRNKVLGKGDCEVLLKRFWKARRESMLPTIGGTNDDETISNSSYTGARDYSSAVNRAGAGGGGGGSLGDLAPDLALGSGGGSATTASSSLTSQVLHGAHDASFALSIEDFYQQWLQQQTGNPKAAIELAYSINDVCDRYQHDPDCGMFLKIMRGVISEHTLAHEMYVVEQLRKVLVDLDMHNTGQLPRSIVHRVLKQLFPSKRYGDALRLRFALIPFTNEDDDGHAFVRYMDLFEEDSEGNQTAFIERLRHQHFDEALEVLVEIETSVRETQQTTGARRSEMPIWQIAHSVRNIDGRMPSGAINHILAVGAACAPSVVQDALDRHASDVKVDIEEFFRRVRRGVYVRRYSPPPEDDVDLLQDEADDADVEDAEEGNDAEGDSERLRALVQEAKEQEETEGSNLVLAPASSLSSAGPHSPSSAGGDGSVDGMRRGSGGSGGSSSNPFGEIPDAGNAFSDSPPDSPQSSRRPTVTATPPSAPATSSTRSRTVVSIVTPQDDNSSFAVNNSFAGGGNELLTL